MKVVVDSKANNANLTGDITSVGNATTIGANKVVSAMIANETIVAEDIATDAITTAKIATANVTNAKLASAIDAIKLADGTVTNAALQYIGALTSDAQAQIIGLSIIGNSNTKRIDGAVMKTGDQTIAGAKTFSATIVGNVTGNVTGNATTATKLATPRTINGEAFDGSQNITITAVAAANSLTGTALADAVVTSKLTSVGTLEDLTVTNAIAGSITGNAATAAKLVGITNSNIVELTETQTLLNKTLTSPTITGTGAIAGTFTGNLTGDVTGNLTGNVTGDVYASNGTSKILASGTDGTDATFTGDLTGNADTATTATTATTQTTGDNTTKIATTAFVTSAIVDNLTTETTNVPLSAKQGKVLKDLIDVLQGQLAVTAPGAPTNLKATPGGTGKINITFDFPVSSGGGAINKFTATSNPGNIINEVLGASTNVINATGLDDNTAYTFTAIAFNNGGNSLKSSSSLIMTTSGIPYPITNLAVSAGAGIGELTVNFDAPAIKISEVTTGYTITATPTSGTPVVKTTTVAGATTVAGLAGDETYTLAVVTNNEFGSSSQVSSSGIYVPLSIGSLHAGGVVFWLDPTDNTKGLVCALEEQSLGIRWNNGSNVSTGATGFNIGEGATNTDKVIAVQGPDESDYAAGKARAYRGGSYDDWFLPSKNELNQMYINKDLLNSVAGFTAFSPSYYWSSTEVDNDDARLQNFGNGIQAFDFKYTTFSVRAVRAF